MPNSEKLKRIAIIEGNLTMAKLIPLLRPAEKKHQDTIAYTHSGLIFIGDKFNEYSLKEQYSIICHEFLHIVYKHAERLGDRKRKLYNIAADIIVNKQLESNNRSLPQDSCTYESCKVPPEYNTTIKIYKYLEENGVVETLEMVDLGYEQKELSDAEATDAKNIEEMASKERTTSSRDQSERENIIAISQDFNEKINWFQELKQYIGTLAIRDNVKTYTRPPRIHIAGILRRGGYVTQYVPKINIIVDISGSMGNTPIDICNKINAIKEDLKIFQPTYYWLNTNYGIIENFNNIPLGGGTDLSLVLQISNADLNVLITDCEDAHGEESILGAQQNIYIITTNCNTKIKKNQFVDLFITPHF